MKHLHRGDPAELVESTNGEGHGTPHAAAPKSQQSQADFQAANLSGQEAATVDKTFATLRARLAFGGFTLSGSDAADGPTKFYVTCWGMARGLKDTAAVQAFARQVGLLK